MSNLYSTFSSPFFAVNVTALGCVLSPYKNPFTASPANTSNDFVSHADDVCGNTKCSRSFIVPCDVRNFSFSVTMHEDSVLSNCLLATFAMPSNGASMLTIILLLTNGIVKTLELSSVLVICNKGKVLSPEAAIDKISPFLTTNCLFTQALLPLMSYSVEKVLLRSSTLFMLVIFDVGLNTSKWPKLSKSLF